MKLASKIIGGLAAAALAGAGLLSAAPPTQATASPASGYTGFVQCWGTGTEPALIGSIEKTSGSLVRGAVIGTLPRGCAPRQGQTRVPVAVGNAATGSGTGTSSLIIERNGDLKLAAPNAALEGHTVVYLDGVQFTRYADPGTPPKPTPSSTAKPEEPTEPETPPTPSEEPEPEPSDPPTEEPSPEPPGGGMTREEALALCEALGIPDPEDCARYLPIAFPNGLPNE